MKKMVLILMSLMVLGACAHTHKCACGSEAKTECAGCKEAGHKADCGCSEHKH